MDLPRTAAIFLIVAMMPTEQISAQQMTWTQEAISKWNGIPPLPPSASRSQSAQATTQCSGSDIVGHTASFWSSSKDCHDWIDRVSELSARGPTQRDVFSICMLEGAIFKQVAQMRDDGASPQFTLKAISSFADSGFSTNFLKATINRVFFDPAFTNAGGGALQQQMSDICIHPNGRYRPLK